MTVTAVVLGVTFVVGTLVLTDTANKLFADQFADADSGVDVVVRSASAFDSAMGVEVQRDPLPTSIVEDVRATDGVADAAGQVFERMREIGLLRAVGSTRAQVAAMVQREAPLVAVLGVAVGVALGVVFGWAAVGALGDSRASMTVTIPGGQLVVYLTVAAIAGLLAGVLPARRAARLDVLTAISTD
jgi:putative ABC transport system permease protein